MNRSSVALLRMLSLRHFRRHGLRTALALLSVAVGVAAFLGMAALNRGVLDSFARTARLRAGGSDLVLRGGRGGIPRELAVEAARLPGVRAAVPVVTRFIDVTQPLQARLLLFGVDPATLPSDLGLLSQEAIVELANPLKLLLGGTPLFLAQSFAQVHGIAAGSELTVATPDGFKRARVAGLLRDDGLFAAYGGAVAATQLDRALELTGRSRLIDRIQVFLAPDADSARLREELVAVAAGRADVSDPLELAREFDATLGSFRLGLRFLSFLSLLIAAFLVHSTLSMALAERRRELSLARCLGLPARMLRWLLLAEGAVIGALGAALGVPLGHLLAHTMSGLFWSTVGRTFDHIDVTLSAPSLVEQLLGFAAGIGAALVAVVPPALQAARRAPLVGLQAERMESAATSRSRWPALGALLLAAAAVVGFAGGGFGVAHSGYVVALLLVGAFTLGAHPLLSALLRGTGPLLLKLLGPAGRLARDHCERSVGPTSLTVVAITLGFGLVYSTDVLVKSYERMLDDWFATTVGEDLFVMGEDFLTSGLQGTDFDFALGDEMRRLPGVLHVHALRFNRIRYRGERVVLLAFDGGAPVEAGRAIYVDGGAADRDRLARGEGVFVSEGFAHRFGRGRGTTIELPAPSGAVTFPVLAVVADYTWPTGVIWIDDDRYRAVFEDREVQEFAITLDGTRPLEGVRGDLEKIVAGRFPAVVLETAKVQATVLEIFHRYWSLLLAQEGIAISVAFLGTLHTLLISVLLRRREIAVLRALGAPLKMLASMLWTEGVLLGLAGGVLGVFFGIGTGAIVLRLLSLEEQGFAVPVRPSLTVALLTVAGAGFTGWLAGLLPGRAAARVAPRAALLDTLS